jgi:hypothetical protein
VGVSGANDPAAGEAGCSLEAPTATALQKAGIDYTSRRDARGLAGAGAGSLLNERQPRSTCKLTTHHRRGEASRQNRRSAPGHRKPNQSDHAGRGSEADTAASGARLASAGNWSSAPPAQSTSYGLSAVAFPVFSELSGHATSASNLKPNAWHLTLVTCPLTIHSRIPNTGKP